MITTRHKVRAQENAIKWGYLSAASFAATHLTLTVGIDVVWGQQVYGDAVWYVLIALGALAPMLIAPVAGVTRYRYLMRQVHAQHLARADEVTPETVSVMVDTFYGQVMQDARLAPIFRREIGPFGSDWTVHLSKMKLFWRAVLIGDAVFKGTPMEAHAKIPNLSSDDFKTWLGLFRDTLDEIYQPAVADAIMEKAARIAQSLELGYGFRAARAA
jgi:hemoglobin